MVIVFKALGLLTEMQYRYVGIECYVPPTGKIIIIGQNNYGVSSHSAVLTISRGGALVVLSFVVK